LGRPRSDGRRGGQVVALGHRALLWSGTGPTSVRIVQRSCNPTLLDSVLRLLGPSTPTVGFVTALDPVLARPPHTVYNRHTRHGRCGSHTTCATAEPERDAGSPVSPCCATPRRCR
jgi:hypothetical protein